MKSFILNFFTSISNLLRWGPIIWKDHNHDYVFILKILQFKLSKTAKYLAKNGNHTNAQRDIDRINTCINLIHLITEEYYQDECLELFYAPYRDGNTGPDFVENQYQLYFMLYPRMYKKSLLIEGLNTSMQRAIYISSENQQRAIRLLFLIMEKNIQYWWY